MNDEKQPVIEDGDDSNHVNGSAEKSSSEYACNGNDNVEDNNDVGDGHKLEEFETNGQKCEAELLEVVA